MFRPARMKNWSLCIQTREKTVFVDNIPGSLIAEKVIHENGSFLLHLRVVDLDGGHQPGGMAGRCDMPSVFVIRVPAF